MLRSRRSEDLLKRGHIHLNLAFELKSKSVKIPGLTVKLWRQTPATGFTPVPRNPMVRITAFMAYSFSWL